jgi:hypothetical protein
MTVSSTELKPINVSKVRMNINTWACQIISQSQQQMKCAALILHYTVRTSGQCSYISKNAQINFTLPFIVHTYIKNSVSGTLLYKTSLQR